MNRLLLFWALLSVSCTSFKNSGNKSSVVILGTIHSNAEKINSDSIYEVLSSFKRNIILVELECDADVKIKPAKLEDRTPTEKFRNLFRSGLCI